MRDPEEDGVVYFIENGRHIRKAYVAEEGPFYSLRYEGWSGRTGGIRLRRSRIYKTREAAEAAIKEHHQREQK